MVMIPLSEQTVERLRALARQYDTDISDLLEMAVARFLAAGVDTSAQLSPASASAPQQVIDREQRLYAARHADLLARYAGETIAMVDGEVIDHDADRAALSRRIRQRYGNQPIFMTPVLPDPVQQIEVRSPYNANNPNGR